MAIDPSPEMMLRQALEVLRKTGATCELPREGLTDAERELVDYLEPTMPPLVARASVSSYLGGLSGRTLANLDSQGVGVERCFVIGREVYYRRPDFLRFVVRRGVKLNFKDPVVAQLRRQRKASQEPGASHRG